MAARIDLMAFLLRLSERKFLLGGHRQAGLWLPLLRLERAVLSWFVQIEAFDWIDFGFPRRLLESLGRVHNPRLPALANAVAAEVDVLGVVLAVEARSEKAHDVHPGEAAVG